MKLGLLSPIRKPIVNFLRELGSIGIFFHQIMRTLFQTRGNFKPIMAQVASVSLRSLSTVIFAGIFVGGILVLQFELILAQYDAQSVLGGLNTSAFMRAIGPL